MNTCIKCKYYTIAFENTCCNPNSRRYVLTYCNPDNTACEHFEEEVIG